MGEVYTSGKRGGKPKQIDGFTGSMQIITETTTWTCPASGEYYISCIGQGGSHFCGATSWVNSAIGTTGGGGGISESNLKLQKGVKINITIDAGVSSFGSYLSATGGENADESNVPKGGNGNGGNVGNFAGEKGKTAKLTLAEPYVQGGGTSTSAKYGGASGGICEIGGTFAEDVAFSPCPSPLRSGMYPYGSSQSWGSPGYDKVPLTYGKDGYIKNGAVIIEYMG